MRTNKDNNSKTTTNKTNTIERCVDKKQNNATTVLFADVLFFWHCSFVMLKRVDLFFVYGIVILWLYFVNCCSSGKFCLMGTVNKHVVT